MTLPLLREAREMLQDCLPDPEFVNPNEWKGWTRRHHDLLAKLDIAIAHLAACGEQSRPVAFAEFGPGMTVMDIRPRAEGACCVPLYTVPPAPEEGK